MNRNDFFEGTKTADGDVRRLGHPSPALWRTVRPVRAAWYYSASAVAVFFAANTALAFVAKRSSLFATMWALSLLVVGAIAYRHRNSWERVSLVVAYIAGAEIIWRGGHALVFWEYGKYLPLLLMGVGVLSEVRRGRRFEVRAVIFAACMAPSLLALPYFDRSDVAFNLSGPICLAVAVMFFFEKPVTRDLLAKICISYLGPVVGLAALSTFGTFAADPETFRIGGKATTAGIGPNQVSSVLGLGVFVVFLLLLIGPKRPSFRFFMGGIGVWLLAQTLLSFSRGGFYAGVGAVIVAAFPLMRSPKSRWTLAVTSVFFLLVFRFVVIPATDKVSHGMASRRMTDTRLTGRDKIMKADWMIFLENPVLGVGPGQSYGLHARTFRASSAHTEYTRLLAEHGSFGVLALFMLFSIGWSRWRKRGTPLSQAIAWGLTAWALLYLGHAAMRQVLPALCFGLGGARFLLDDRALRRPVRPVPRRQPLPVQDR